MRRVFVEGTGSWLGWDLSTRILGAAAPGWEEYGRPLPASDCFPGVEAFPPGSAPRGSQVLGDR